MDWVGIGGSIGNPNDGDWLSNQDRMQSVQTVSGRNQHQFKDGDKVHITNASTNELTVSLTDSSSSQPLTVTVSGLVVGRTGSDTPTIGNGNVTIDGDGGIIADATSATGEFLPTGTGTPTLVPTGKLKKYGNGRLTLKNAAPNIINEGTDLHGGEIVVAAPDASSPATLFSQALDITDTTDSMRGHVRFTGEAGDVRQVTIERGISGIRNHFHVDAGMNNNTFQNNDDVTIVALANNSTVHNRGGVFYVGQNADLTIHANGSLTFNDNSYQDSGTIANDIYIDSNATVLFNVASEKGVFIGSGIGADGVTGNTIIKTGLGLVQIGSDSLFGGATTVSQGTFRVVGDGSGTGAGTVVYGQDTSGTFAMTSQVDQNTVLAGGGIIVAENFTFGSADSGGNVYIRPDAATFTASNMTVRNEEKFATLTLQGTGTGTSTATFDSTPNITNTARDGFWFDYDVAAPNAVHENASDVTDTEKYRSATRNDLLYLNNISTVTLNGGVINFTSGTGLTTGQYLIIDSDTPINLPSHTSSLDGINDADGILWGRLNGAEIKKDSPRGKAEFYFDNISGQPAQSQVWLTVSHNSLQMDWTGGDGAWGTPGSWVSRQIGSTGERDYQFTNGDFVYFAGNSSNIITLTDDVIVSGLSAGRNSSDVVANGNITIAGTGGIHATALDANLITGTYANTGDAQNFSTTGRLQKYGTGVLTFENTGINTFEEGIDLNAGTIGFNKVNQLLVGTGKEITFTGDATLKANETASLDPHIAVNSGATGELAADTDDVMLLRDTIDGQGSINKTGQGTVQIATSNYAIDRTTVTEGTFRIAGTGTTYTTASDFTVEEQGTLAGNGTVKSATTIVVNGHISPDAAVLTETQTSVDSSERFATVTLQGTTELDGFVMDYDAGTPSPTVNPSVASTGDLLQVTGAGNLVGGTINFSAFTRAGMGSYLIINSTQSITVNGAAGTNGTLDGIEHGGVLELQINGTKLSNSSPRGVYEFVFADGDAANSQIWLTGETNTLSMNGIGGTGDWRSGSWQSSQQTQDGNRESNFAAGDFVTFADKTQDSTVTIVNTETVSGMETDTDKNVVFSGTGGIHAIAENPDPANTFIYGEYARTDGSADPGKDQFNTTGMYRKYGSGTTTFENTGGNLFEEGVELFAGATEFTMANQLDVGAGNAITFKGNAILRPTASLIHDTAIAVDDGATGAFDVGQDIVYTYAGALTSGSAGAINKTGAGTMALRADSPQYQGGITVSGGTLDVHADYGNAASFTIGDGATLSGTGIIGGIGAGGVIESGGTLAPSGMAEYSSGAISTVDHLTVNGDLTFAGESTYAVTLGHNTNSRAGGQSERMSDRVNVEGDGVVTIDPNAHLDVTFKYWDASPSVDESDRFTIIDATNGRVGDSQSQFILNTWEILPRGIQLVQGWNQSLFQLWFEGDPDNTFENIANSHNRTQIGMTLDQLVQLRDSGLSSAIALLSSPSFSDSQLADFLGGLAGDIGANALDMSLKSPGACHLAGWIRCGATALISGVKNSRSTRRAPIAL
ncbi:MAG: autotransporter-associated beta strand repeat-containing protein [Planctomycetes bacterium]|nr:autotransporter-associated beta strand repeat-containing protein [Planctomycetota bacterium]